MSLFQKSVLSNYLDSISDSEIDKGWSSLQSYKEMLSKVQTFKEEVFQAKFLEKIFVDCFSYKSQYDSAEEGNLFFEQKNTSNSKKADGAIKKNGEVIAVIELKSTKTKNLDDVKEQAFGYYLNNSKCEYVITSNFNKLRFYIERNEDYLEFDLFNIDKEEFKLLWLCIDSKNLLEGKPKEIKNKSLISEENITKKLYQDYSTFRQELFNDLVENNQTVEKRVILNKTQKLLDRLLFILFSEDRGLLPANSISEIINHWEFGGDSLYSTFLTYFEIINKGRPKRGDKKGIYAYNGGLFSEDIVLNTLNISDDVLLSNAKKLTKYDFESDVSVDILGHIFEHSLSEIEELQNQIDGAETDKSKSKRKKDGVYYTPKYITKYIVDNTLGKLCDEKKIELDINEETYSPSAKRSRNRISALDDYRSWLLQLTICDPACGSGAFLIQALNFLIKEHHYIDELSASYNKDSLLLSDVKNSILENNLYGVDINQESVEIAKLSLWLNTAESNRKLTSLNNNIKCGNSLIDDPEIAGDKAFNWQKEFPEIFAHGGFDIIIGNPPYGIFMSDVEQDHYSKYFPLTNYKINLYVLFIERMLQIFNNGIVHFIIPKSLLFNTYYKNIREVLLNTTQINEIHTITEKVFKDAEVGSSLLLNFEIKKDASIDNKVRLIESKTSEIFISKVGVIENLKSQKSFLSIPNYEISIIDQSKESIQKKLLKLDSIRSYYKFKNGLNPGNIKHILVSPSEKSKNHRPIIWGKDISKYQINWSGDYINYDKNIGNKITVDEVKSKQGMKKQNRIDYALRSPELFENKKIVVRKTGDKLIACLDSENYYFDTLVHGVYEMSSEYSLEALVAILNSKPATIFYRILHDVKGKVFAKISLDNLSSFPMPKISDEIEKKLSVSSNMMLVLNKNLQEVSGKFRRILQRKFPEHLEKLPKKIESWHELSFADFLKQLKKKKIELGLAQEVEWEDYFLAEQQKILALQTQINQTDKEIDQMVYELYGLTKEEIEIVENS